MSVPTAIANDAADRWGVQALASNLPQTQTSRAVRFYEPLATASARERNSTSSIFEAIRPARSIAASFKAGIPVRIDSRNVTASPHEISPSLASNCRSALNASLAFSESPARAASNPANECAEYRVAVSLAVLCSYVGCTREPAVKMGLWENTTTQTTKTTGTIPQRMAQEMHQRGMPPDSSFQRFKFPISRFPGTMGLLPISR